MNLEALQISWVMCALFFGITHTVMAIVISSIPTNVDEAIKHLEWLIGPLNLLRAVSFISLILAIILLWLHSITQGSYGWYVVSAGATILGMLSYFGSTSVLHRTIQSRLRGND